MDDPGPMVVALVAGAASIFFSAVETALLYYSGPRLLEVAKRRGREDAARRFIRDDEDHLLAHQALGFISRPAFVLALFAWTLGPRVSPNIWSILEAGLIATGFFLTIGGALPTFLGRMYPEAVLRHLFRPLLLATVLATPLTWALKALRRLAERLAGRPLNPEGHDHIQEEILSAVGEGELEGVLGEDEADMIEAALQLRDSDVADAMTPRTRMFAIEISTPLAEAVAMVSESGHSRVPLFRERHDEIVGVLYAKDLLPQWNQPGAEKLTLARIARKPFFVPETKRISQLLDEFKRSRTHLAVVVDEYGGTAGIITIEDILEEIVGEIADEFDEGVDAPLLKMVSETEAEIDAHVHVDDLGDALGVEIASDEFDTVGGLVFTALGRVPSPGDEFDYADMHITVLEADERSVSRVKVVRTGP